MPYLTGYSVEILPVRGESVNVSCLLRAILKLSFWRGRPLQAYTDAYIQVVSPTVILTYIDNDTAFYSISNRFPNIRTIFLQNGTRGESGDVFGSLVQSNNYRVDYMLVHGVAIGKHYQKFILGETIVVGSLKNNRDRKSSDVVPRSILFISQYHDKPKNNEPCWVERDGTPIYWDQFFAAERRVLSFLSKWCVENDKLLWICGRGDNKDGTEKDFYTEQLKGCMWKYIPRSDSKSSYKQIDSAELVVFIDSTLGYEAICRGKKTASFSCRGSSLNSPATKFGWPAVMSDNGPFWTNKPNEKDFRRIMDYLETVSDEEWEKTRKFYANDLMEFDAGNTRFIALLDQLLQKK